MRQERTGEHFARENRRLAGQVLVQAAAATYGAVTPGPPAPAVDAAQRVVELEHERLDHRPSGKRNDIADQRPFLRSVMSEQQWGPRPALPDPKAAVDARRVQIQQRIGELLTARANAMAGGPIEQELRALQQQLDALPTT